MLPRKAAGGYMRKEQFDILVALEKDRLPHTANELAALTGRTDAADIVAELTEQGLVTDSAITAQGVAAWITTRPSAPCLSPPATAPACAP